MAVDFVLHGLLATGIVIILGLVGGKLATRIHLPKISGYLLMGVAIGPTGLNLVTEDITMGLGVVKDLALGMLLFAIGGVFEFHRFKNIGETVTRLGLIVAGLTFGIVSIGALFVTRDVVFAALLGSIAVTTSPGAALLVTREYNTTGPFTESLILMVGISNVLSIVLFESVVALSKTGLDTSTLHSLTWLCGELIFTVALGGAAGFLLSWWESKVADQAELILAFVAGILVITGLAKSLNLNPLLAALVCGVVTTNLSLMHRLIYVEMRQTEQPLYIAFFVLGGAMLDVKLLGALGLAGAAYLILRAIVRLVATRYFARRLNMTDVVRKYLGHSLIAQGGVAIGLATSLRESLPEMYGLVAPVILGAVILHELVGPPLIRWSLIKSGETRE